MLTEELDRLIHQLIEAGHDIDQTIRILQDLIDNLCRISLDDGLKDAYLCTYKNAISVLSDILDSNQVLCKKLQRLIEECESCSALPMGLFSDDAQAPHDEKTQREDKVDLRRKALADALLKGQAETITESDKIKPVDDAYAAGSDQSILDAICALQNQRAGGSGVVIDSDGHIVYPAEPSAESDGQENVSASEGTACDNVFEGIVVPSAKYAGGPPSYCRVCDNIVVPGAYYCPYCGSAVSVEKPSVKLQKVQFSAIAPKSLSRGEYSIINIIMYEESSRHIVDELLNSMDEPQQEAKSGVQKVNEGASIKVVLNSPDFLIEDNTEIGVWQGEYLEFSFAVQIPDNYRKRQILLSAIVYINEVIATRLKIIIKCSSHSEQQQITVSRSDIFSAFISYASQDRKRVAAIIQGMKKARPDLDVFFDVDSLRSGDDWELALHEEIKRRDVLFLCWSHFARESKWVDAEWRYALEQKGADCIEPVPIESPDICPPPAELSFKHFNDKLLYIIDSVR